MDTIHIRIYMLVNKSVHSHFMVSVMQYIAKEMVRSLPDMKWDLSNKQRLAAWLVYVSHGLIWYKLRFSMNLNGINQVIFQQNSEHLTKSRRFTHTWFRNFIPHFIIQMTLKFKPPSLLILDTFSQVTQDIVHGVTLTDTDLYDICESWGGG